MSRFEWGIVIPLQMSDRAIATYFYFEKLKKSIFLSMRKSSPFSWILLEIIIKLYCAPLKHSSYAPTQSGLGHPPTLPLSSKRLKIFLLTSFRKKRSCPHPRQNHSHVSEYYGIRMDDTSANHKLANAFCQENCH